MNLNRIYVSNVLGKLNFFRETKDISFGSIWQLWLTVVSRMFSDIFQQVQALSVYMSRKSQEVRGTEKLEKSSAFHCENTVDSMPLLLHACPCTFFQPGYATCGDVYEKRARKCPCFLIWAGKTDLGSLVILLR